MPTVLYGYMWDAIQKAPDFRAAFQELASTEQRSQSALTMREEICGARKAKEDASCPVRRAMADRYSSKKKSWRTVASSTIAWMSPPGVRAVFPRTKTDAEGIGM